MAGGTRQLLAKHERREAILHAAARAFAAGGYAATSMDDVAAESGVTKLIVYRHFDSKEALYRAVLERVSTAMREEAVRDLQGSHLRTATVRGLLRVARDDPDGYRLLVFHAPREAAFEPQARGYWEDAVSGIDERLGDGVRDPALRSWVARSVMSYLLHEVLLWLEVGDPTHDESFVAAASDGLAALVGAWASPGST